MNFIFNSLAQYISGRDRSGAAPDLSQDPASPTGWRLASGSNVRVMRTWETSGFPAGGTLRSLSKGRRVSELAESPLEG